MLGSVSAADALEADMPVAEVSPDGMAGFAGWARIAVESARAESVRASRLVQEATRTATTRSSEEERRESIARDLRSGVECGTIARRCEARRTRSVRRAT